MSEDARQASFPPPTHQQVEHALRDLNYAERLVGYKMTPSAGNAANDMYGLREAVLFLTGNPWDQPMLNPAFKGALNWIDVSKLVEWLRDVIGDADLAHAIEEQAAGLEPYRLQSEKIAELVNERMLQYRDVHDAATAAGGDAE